MASRKIWDNLKPGNEYASRRNLHGTIPAGYTWNSATYPLADMYGTPPDDTEDSDQGFRERRLLWLSQFDLVIVVEGRWRYWRWLAEPVAEDDPVPQHQGRRIAWWERRKTTAPLPAQPGLWPQDG